MKTVDEAITQLSSVPGEQRVTCELLRLKQEEAEPAVGERECGEPTGNLNECDQEEPFSATVNKTIRSWTRNRSTNSPSSDEEEGKSTN